MTMAEHNLVSHLLDGMVHCRKCNTTMTTAGGSFGETPKYVCPNSSEGCDTPEIPAEPFNRVVVESVIRAALAGENIKRVSEIVHENAEKECPEFLTESFIFNPKTFTSAPELYLLALGPREASNSHGSGRICQIVAQTPPVLDHHGRHGTYRRIRPRYGHLPASQQHPDHQDHHGHRGR